MASPTSHSDLFSPSSGARLIACPGSAKASKGIPEKISLFSSEGTDAHELASVRLLNSLGEKAEINTGDLTWYSKEIDSDRPCHWRLLWKKKRLSRSFVKK